MERVTISAIKRWALDVDCVDDLERLADELREVVRDPRLAQPSPVDGTGGDDGGAEALPSPNLGPEEPLAELEDAVCLLLQRFLSPAREGDPRLLSDLLYLALRLRVAGARETVAGLLIGGAYRDQEGPDGPLEDQMVKVLQACGVDDDQRRLLRELIGGAAGEDPERTSAESGSLLPSLGDEEPPTILPGDQVPQVNDPDQVFGFVDAVKEGIANRRAYADHARVSIRQADFVARAAAALGLVEVARGGLFEITERGLRLPFTEDPVGRAIRHQVVGEHPLIRALDLQDAETLPTLERIQDLLASRTELGPGTIRRRAQALRRWVEWWASGGR